MLQLNGQVSLTLKLRIQHDKLYPLQSSLKNIQKKVNTQ